tara:strand:- start:6006 stop:7307 length:1302 start_codon:yes stop_codon:yes gene_type:complete
MSKEIEIQVIAHLIDEPKNYFINSSRLSEKLFEDDMLKNVFIAYAKLVREGKKPNAGSITEDDDSRIYLLELLSQISYEIDFDGWLDMLIGKWKEREFSKIMFTATLFKRDVNESIQDVQQKLSTLNDVNVNEPKQISEHIDDVFKTINENQTKSGLTGIDTGLYLLNTFTGGWQGGDLVIVAGDTSQGKTSLSLQFARVSALTKTPTAIYSYEMSTKQLTARIMSQQAEVSSKSMLIGKLEDEQIVSMRQRLFTLNGVPLYIDDCSSSQLQYLLNSMTAMSIAKGVKLFIVDYLQLISNPNKGGNKEQEVAGIARELKNFAKRTNTTVILLSQLSRQQNKRTGSEPRLSDLRDSGQIEEAADIVILCYRPEVYGVGQFDDGAPTDGKAELIVAKGRNIGLSRFILNFNKELTLFSNYNDSTSYNQSESNPDF